MRTRRRRGTAAAAAVGVAALLVGLTGCSAPDAVTIDLPAQAEGALPEDTLSQLSASVDSAMAAAGASGAIVGVWAPWSGSWVEGVGTQKPGGGDEVTADMAFRAGQVTRAMTCDLLFQADADGALDLDDPVTKWVGGFPDLTDVSLRQLCDGTSGIGSYTPQLRAEFFQNPSRQWDPRELAGYGLGQGRTAAGTAYADSDSAYLLLGAAIERATGESLSDLVQERIAEPLGLDATRLPGRDPAPAGDGPVLAGHWSMPDAGGAWNCAEPAEFTDVSASMGGANAGAVTDIDDLGRYAQALATRALTPQADDRFSTPLPIADQPTWFTAEGGAYQAGSLIGQYGSFPGYTTAAFADPATGLTVAVVLNNSGGNPQMGAWLAWELAAIASKAAPASGQTAPQAGLPWSAQQFHDTILQNAICPQPAS